MLESSIERAFKNAVDKNGDLCFKVKIVSLAGYPDRIVFFKEGGFMWMELKAPGKEPRKLQAYRIKQLREFNHAVYWTSNKEEAIQFYETEKSLQARASS